MICFTETVLPIFKGWVFIDVGFPDILCSCIKVLSGIFIGRKYLWESDIFSYSPNSATKYLSHLDLHPMFSNAFETYTFLDIPPKLSSSVKVMLIDILLMLVPCLPLQLFNFYLSWKQLKIWCGKSKTSNQGEKFSSVYTIEICNPSEACFLNL